MHTTLNFSFGNLQVGRSVTVSRPAGGARAKRAPPFRVITLLLKWRTSNKGRRPIFYGRAKFCNWRHNRPLRIWGQGSGILGWSQMSAFFV